MVLGLSYSELQQQPQTWIQEMRTYLAAKNKAEADNTPKQ